MCVCVCVCVLLLNSMITEKIQVTTKEQTRTQCQKEKYGPFPPCGDVRPTKSESVLRLCNKEPKQKKECPQIKLDGSAPLSPPTKEKKMKSEVMPMRKRRNKEHETTKVKRIAHKSSEKPIKETAIRKNIKPRKNQKHHKRKEKRKRVCKKEKRKRPSGLEPLASKSINHRIDALTEHLPNALSQSTTPH